MVSFQKKKFCNKFELKAFSMTKKISNLCANMPDKNS